MKNFQNYLEKFIIWKLNIQSTKGYKGEEETVNQNDQIIKNLKTLKEIIFSADLRFGY